MQSKSARWPICAIWPRRFGEYQRRHSGYPMGDFRQASNALVQDGIVATVPTRDGWKTPYDYRATDGFAANRRLVAGHYLLRSAGSDRAFEEGYTAGPFEPASYEIDMVVSDSVFLRWPQVSARSHPPEPRRAADS